MKKVLVTGSNGLLGQKLVQQILDDYQNTFQLIAISRGENRNPLAKKYYHQIDITEKDTLSSFLKSEKPDVIINTAAMTQVDKCETEKEACWDLNVKAVENLIDISESLGKNTHLIHLSTDFIFDGEAGPYKEEDVANPLSYYGESKLAAEKLFENTQIPWSIVRTVLVYGIVNNMSRSNIVLWVKKSLEEGKKINVVDDQWRTPTLAEDLAKGCLLIAEKQAKGIFHVSGEEMMTPYDIAIETARFFNLDVNLITRTDGSKFQQTAKRPPKTGFILDKVKQELKYQPHTFSEGLGVLSKQLDTLVT